MNKKYFTIRTYVIPKLNAPQQTEQIEKLREKRVTVLQWFYMKHEKSTLCFDKNKKGS